MKPVFFKTPKEFNQWLKKNHDKEKELIVGYYKKGTGIPSITWPESVKEALCYGWIDGIRRSLDEESYCIRFTPRKPTSIWSAVNIKYVEELMAEKRMQPAGIKAFEALKDHRSKVYSYENRNKAELSPAFEKQFKANKKAWKFFQESAPYYRKTLVHYIMSAKKDETRIKRLHEAIHDSENGRKIKTLAYPKK